MTHLHILSMFFKNCYVVFIFHLRDNFIQFKMYWYTTMLFGLVFKGDNFCDFLFASLKDKMLPKRGLLIKEKDFGPNLSLVLLSITQ